ncbi:unnamed protein product [Parnassius apollo]|uniref:(apollo) hypothetical protein n=1 Tax=Parnassius apollo TaxID=110799 RepID=A0A8S3XS97_PARAO|nr:unnamed protein product [Parnassius apollo]
MPNKQSCCCWRNLRLGCYAAAFFAMVYFSATTVNMEHFREIDHRYLSGKMKEPEPKSFLEPNKITPITVSLNITRSVCGSFGFVACILLIIGVYKDIKYLLLPWIVAMGLIILVELINVVYEFYMGTLNFNPITSFLITLDFLTLALNIYAMFCVISQFQEYLKGRGTAAFDESDRLAAVQYTATAQHTTTTSSAPSGRRRSAGKPMPSCDPEEFSEAPRSTKANTSALSKISHSAVKKHVQFPDEQSSIEEVTEGPVNIAENSINFKINKNLGINGAA